MKTKHILIVLFLFSPFGSRLFGHEQIVHQVITTNAEASAFAHSSAYTDFLNTVSSDRARLPRPGANGLAQSMVDGSYDEDFAGQDEGGNRSYNHFYDPLGPANDYGKGLSDAPFVGRVFIGKDSFTWASTSNCPGHNFYSIIPYASNIGTSNIWSWQNARGEEWLGLTATNQLERQTDLDKMFRAIGQVMHLLEDASQPQHVRNEQHVFPTNTWIYRHFDPFISPIEEYGKKHFTSLNYGDGSMLDWRANGFTKLEDFWDRHEYAPGNATVLNNAENGGAQLGLAEWCDGNFLGARHLFPEYYRHGDIEYYPYPSQDQSTDYSDVKLHPEDHIYDVTLENNVTGKGIYLAKTGDGITYNHIARINYLGAKLPGLVGQYYCTIDDPNVLKDYHANFIPKAVKYSAGLLDYFFRGTMNVTVIGYDTNTLMYTNLIVNTSSQDFSNGKFSIYTNDASGNRYVIACTNLSDVLPGGDLAANQSMLMVFPGPIFPTNDLLLVYQGSIGTTDPADANIAIAATTFHVWSEQTLGYDDFNEDDGGFSLPYTISTNLVSDDFPFPLVAGHYQVSINNGVFDDIGTIGGVSTTILGTDCGYPATFDNLPVIVPTGQVSIVGNHLEIVMMCTDNCPINIGWQNVSVTWRAWP
jgi:hypothetical protein